MATKQTKSKAVVSKPKHRSFRLTPRSGLLSLAVIGLFSVVGVMGYNQVKNGSITAGAYNYTWVANDNAGGSIQACWYQSNGLRIKMSRTNNVYAPATRSMSFNGFSKTLSKGQTTSFLLAPVSKSSKFSYNTGVLSGSIAGTSIRTC